MSLVTEAPEEIVSANKPAESVARVATVFTGGTIAMTATTNKGVIPTLAGSDIMARIPELARFLPNVELEVYDFATLPGPHISPEMMLTLAGFVQELLHRVDGIVITHGTDSMEECAYFLDLAIAEKKPIVFTGAMHPSTDAGWDGGKNLLDAVAVASSMEFYDCGVLVVLDGTVHAASEVLKSHTTRTDTFRSADFGQLGTVHVLENSLPHRIRFPHHRLSIAMNSEVDLPYVELLKAYSGMDDRLFVCAMKGDARGIVVEAMGQGNVPPGAVNGIARACEMGIPVVITSRCPAGAVRPFYAYEGAGKELERLGCLFSPYLSGPKARIKVMLALAAGYSSKELANIFPKT